jgi:branched-chain amino acid transport system permease protein
VTLGLVFVGEHIFRQFKHVTGGAGIGRAAPDLSIFGVDLETTSSVFGVGMDREMKLYFFSLALLVVLGVLAKNLTRSAVGRALAAVRDRDLAASIMGIQLTRYKAIAFSVSAFYAGIAGAMLTTVTGFIEPGTYNLFLSVEFLAMVLIGGAGTFAGALLGAAFVTLLPRLVQEVPALLPFITNESTGGFLTTFQLNTIIYGALIVAFLVLEPRGLFGLWVRARAYFRAWPFSY